MIVRMEDLRFAVRADIPYRLYHHHVILPCGKVAYTDHASLESYAAEHGGEYRVITGDELDALISEHEQSLVTLPAPIERDQFWYFLEVLPPCRWHDHKGVELFHVSERLTGDLVQWCARIGDAHYGFIDRAGRASDELVAVVRSAHEGGAA